MISTWLMTMVGFFVALGVLIVFHEWGHFCVARWFGVHVIRFSLGFGKPLCRMVGKKGTEYVLSLFPLGGYVQMLGESDLKDVPEALKSQAFCTKSVWARMAIIAAGPVFNILLAIVALWAMFLIGVTAPAPIIGDVKQGSIAAYAKLEKLDEIMSVDDVSVSNWKAVGMELAPAIGEDTPLILRLYNLKTRTYRFASLNLAGLTLTNESGGLLSALGITPAMPPIPPIIGDVFKDYPGAKAGLLVGDKIIKVDGKIVSDWIELVSDIQHKPDQPVIFTVKRGDGFKTITVYPMGIEQGKQVYGFVGVKPKMPKNFSEVWIRTEHYGVLSAWIPAVQETWRLTLLTFNMLGKLLTGALSLNTIGGPIGMVEWAGQAIELGWSHYFSFIALISVSLGVFNILPIPVLDGGHLLYCFIEVIRGRALSERIRWQGMRLGFMVLAALMLLAIFNDLSRVFHG